MRLAVASQLRLIPPGDERLRRTVRSIALAADRMEKLIGDLLDRTALATGRLSLRLESQDLTALVREGVSLLRPLADEKRQALSIEGAGEGLWVRCDGERIVQVLSNLIGNAIKYTPPGGAITVRAARRESRIEVIVRDTGPGVERQHLPHLFERYWQARPGGRAGMGLGLAIAKGIVDAHGGRIWAEPASSGGVFGFALPSAAPATQAALAPRPEPAPSAPAPPPDAGVDYAEVVQKAQDAIVVADASGAVVEINHAAEQLLGWPSAELRGRPLTLIMPERYRAAHQRGLARFLATGVPTLVGRTVQVEALRRDGREVRVELALSALRESAGLQFSAVIRDLTQVQRLEEAAEAARTRARELDDEVRRRDAFLQTASHELRTPLATLKMQVRRLGRTGATPDAVARLERQTDRLGRLVEHMLDASRVDAGRLEIAPEPFDLAALVSEVVADALAPAHPIAVHAPGDPVPVHADPHRLGQVLYNLLDNAIKYSPQPRPIQVEVSRDGDRARCRVVDQGLGIPAALQGQIFARFCRETSERVRAISGLGVGLYISRAIVEAHGGSIGFSSQEGAGSSFWFEIPSAPAEARPGTPPPAVLVVDDDTDLRESLLQTLEDAHIPSEGVCNGAEALEAIRRRRPAVVLLDLMMPVMDGWECYRRIRADPATHDLPVVVFSGDHAVKRKAADLGASESLGKPVDVDAMIALVRRHFPLAGRAS